MYNLKAFSEDPDVRIISRRLLLAATILSLFAIIETISSCNFYELDTSNNLFRNKHKAVGIFREQYGSSCGAVSSRSANHRKAQAFGILACLSASMCLIALLSTTLLVLKDKVKDKLWLATKLLYLITLLGVIMTFTMRGVCNEPETVCKQLGTAGIITAVNVLLLFLMACAAWLIPLPATQIFPSLLKIPDLNRWVFALVLLLFTVVSWAFSIATIVDCTFIKMEYGPLWKVGPFHKEVSVDGTNRNVFCAVYDQDDYKIPTRMSQASGTLACSSISLSLVTFALVIFVLKGRDREMVWNLTKILHVLALIGVVSTFALLAECHRSFSNLKCWKLGRAGYIALSNVMLLVLIIAASRMISLPETPWCSFAANEEVPEDRTDSRLIDSRTPLLSDVGRDAVKFEAELGEENEPEAM